MKYVSCVGVPKTFHVPSYIFYQFFSVSNSNCMLGKIRSAHYYNFEDKEHLFSAITTLAPEDSVLDYGALGNFSIAGFEMVTHHNWYWYWYWYLRW